MHDQHLLQCRGNVVHLAPSAMDAEHAAKTMEELDRMQQEAGRIQKQPAGAKGASADVSKVSNMFEGLLGSSSRPKGPAPKFG